jgi:L-fuculokinase
MSTPVIAIFDIGKTNKKLFLFDENYRIVYEQSKQLAETIDEDGDPCENLAELTQWVKNSFREVTNLSQFEVRALNFSAYGASFVHLDKGDNPVTPLYSYLKHFPDALKKKFYDTYGGEVTFSMFTASPVLGNLNSGMQLYRLKYTHPELFDAVHVSLHLPQYFSYLFTHKASSDITSIGCHTNLWNFPTHQYHRWVKEEGVLEKLGAICPSDSAMEIDYNGQKIVVGTGLHDSSSALIPYLESFHEPFVLLSTGTWCISLNPFNNDALTVEELKKDCLCYLSYRGNMVKASRVFSGNEHEQQTKRLAEHFEKPLDHYKNVGVPPGLTERWKQKAKIKGSAENNLAFAHVDLSTFATYEDAYVQLIWTLMEEQVISTQLILGHSSVSRIFVDGGFSKNPIFMHLLSAAFPKIEVYAASIAQASALGAALAIHRHWNTKSLPADVMDLKYYAGSPVIR